MSSSKQSSTLSMPIHRESPMQRFTAALLVLLALVATLLVYRPGLSGTFIFDDTPNIVQNQAIAISSLAPDTLLQAAFSSSSGPLSRPISMASFAINYFVSGLDPFYFKLTNLFIHLANGIGVFIFATLLLNFYRRHYQPMLTVGHTSWISLTVAAAWLLHPFNLTSVLYIVQRMASLSAFFCIWGLVLFSWGRIRLYESQGGMLAILASLILFTPLAALSKETGALLPLFMLVAELTLFNFRGSYASTRRGLIAFYGLSVALPALVALIYLVMHPEWLMASYRIRDFDLPQRLMTEARVLWFYLVQIVMPRTTAMAMFHDDIAISRSLMQPLSTLPALLGIVSLPVLVIALRKQAPLLAFGILFYFSGHILESTVFPLEIAHEHRNYLPMIGIVLALFFYMLHPLHPDTLRIRRGLALLLIGLFAFGTLTRAQQWANPFDFTLAEVQHHPDSPRSNDEMAYIYANIETADQTSMERNFLFARYYYEKATTLDTNYTNGLFGLIILSSTRDKPLDPRWTSELMQRLEHAPYASDISDHLVKLVTCQMNGLCKLPVHDIEALFDASLHNPTLIGKNRASVFSAQSYFLVNIVKDYPAGLVAMNRMIASAPGVLENRITLIKYLMALQRFPEAEAQLKILQTMDSKRLYQQQITLYKKMLLDEHHDS